MSESRESRSETRLEGKISSERCREPRSSPSSFPETAAAGLRRRRCGGPARDSPALPLGAVRGAPAQRWRRERVTHARRGRPAGPVPHSVSCIAGEALVEPPARRRLPSELKTAPEDARAFRRAPTAPASPSRSAKRRSSSRGNARRGLRQVRQNPGASRRKARTPPSPKCQRGRARDEDRRSPRRRG